MNRESIIFLDAVLLEFLSEESKDAICNIAFLKIKMHFLITSAYFTLECRYLVHQLM